MQSSRGGLDRHSLAEQQRSEIIDEVVAGIDAVFEEIKPKQITDERCPR